MMRSLFLAGLLTLMPIEAARAETLTAGSTYVAPDFFAFPPTFTGGAEVALCGRDAVNRMWLVVGVASGRPDNGPQVRVFTVDPGGILVSQFDFNAYTSTWAGGVRVSCLVDPNSTMHILTGAGPGGGPHVRLFYFAP